MNMNNLVTLKLKPETLKRYKLPDIPYPVTMDQMTSIMTDDGELPLDVMLLGLQLASRDGEAPWERLEVAMNRLIELIAPADSDTVIAAQGDDWWIELGPVDLLGKLVTIQRGNALIAAMTDRGDGRLRVAVFRPLDAKSLGYLIGLGKIPDPDYGVCMRENNWEYTLDCAAGNGNIYADERGEAYLSYWERGLGVSRDGSEIPDWKLQQELIARSAILGVVELGVYYTLSASVDEPVT